LQHVSRLKNRQPDMPPAKQEKEERCQIISEEAFYPPSFYFNMALVFPLVFHFA